MKQNEQQIILSELFSFLQNNCQEYDVFSYPFEIQLSADPLVTVKPDISIFLNKERTNDNIRRRIPDFIVEIVSLDSQVDDYITKLYYYYEYGVKEYWIIDPQRRRIFVNWFEGGLFNIPYTFDAIIKINIFSNLYINFREILYT